MIVAGRGWQPVTEVDDWLLHRGLGCQIGPGQDSQFPEVDEWGAATFTEQTRMVFGWVPGAWRSASTAENDLWYDVPPGPSVLPLVDDSDWASHRHDGGEAR